MALLHRDHDHETQTDDTVVGTGTTDRPAWTEPARTDAPVATAEPAVVRKNSFGHTLRTVLATVLLVAIVAVAVANTDQVDVDLLFEQYDLPLAALVGAAAGAGLLIGLLVGRRKHHA